MFFSGQTFHICNYRIFTHIIRLIINGLHFFVFETQKTWFLLYKVISLSRKFGGFAQL